MKGESSAAEQVRFVSSAPRLVGDVVLAIVEPWKSVRHNKISNLCIGLSK